MRLTDKSYWDSNYERPEDMRTMSIEGFRTFFKRQLFATMQKVELDAGNILEVGAGGSEWIPFLAGQYPESRFTGIDYSEAGCEILRELAKRGGHKNIEVLCSDFFAATDQHGRFDVLYSHGVIEHFDELDNVLGELRRFLKQGGFAINFIPNMAGSIGSLTKIFNRAVFEMHNPHDLESLVRGHVEAGFEVVDAGYLCSNNFGVLASCFKEKKGLGWNIYKFLSRVSKVVWLFESNVVALPATRFFSPYIYAIAKNP